MFKELQHCFNLLEKAYGDQLCIVVRTNGLTPMRKRKLHLSIVMFVETAHGTVEVGANSEYPFKNKMNYIEWVNDMIKHLDSEVSKVFSQLGVPNAEKEVAEGSTGEGCQEGDNEADSEIVA